MYQEKWVKLEQFYMMLEDIARGSRYQVEYLLNKEGCIVTELVDMMLINKSPKADPKNLRYEMGSDYTPAFFKPLVSMLSHLVLSMHTEDMPDEIETHNKF